MPSLDTYTTDRCPTAYEIALHFVPDVGTTAYLDLFGPGVLAKPRTRYRMVRGLIVYAKGKP